MSIGLEIRPNTEISDSSGAYTIAFMRVGSDIDGRGEVVDNYDLVDGDRILVEGGDHISIQLVYMINNLPNSSRVYFDFVTKNAFTLIGEESGGVLVVERDGREHKARLNSGKSLNMINLGPDIIRALEVDVVGITRLEDLIDVVEVDDKDDFDWLIYPIFEEILRRVWIVT